MIKEVSLKIKTKFANELRRGYPLIQKDGIINIHDLNEEGTLVKLVDERNQFIGKGYYGRQNKGYGWVLTKNEKEAIDEAFFTRTLKKAVEKRKLFYEDTETTSFRVFNGEGDGIGGLTIDYYAGWYVLTWYSVGMYAFKDMVISALTSIVEYQGIYQKKRFDAKGQYVEDDDFVMGKEAPAPLIVKENKVKIAVYLNDGAMVGVFLDQRPVRKLIRDKYAAGKHVLNTFSYTGAFSVFAAVGGAERTTSVDLANRSLQKTKEQFQINDIDLTSQQIIVEDVFHYFKYAVRKQLSFDMVILDPPSFARSKKHTFSAAKDYKNLLKEAIAITKDNGIIVASTNCSTFGMNKFKGFIDTAFGEMKANYELLEEFSLPEDFRTVKSFPEGNYLKVVFVRKKG